MIDVSNPQSVLTAIGQNPLDAIGSAVRDTRADFETYRSTLPAIAARHSARGVLNWIHDQFFAHARVQFETLVKETSILDSEPVRDIFVGHNFRYRFKKHSANDRISSYPTAGYLDFVAQDPPQLIQEVRLIGGYRWDPEFREIGSAVLSARDGKHNILWVLELSEPEAGSGATHFQPKSPDSGLPPLPEIVESVEIQKESGAE